MRAEPRRGELDRGLRLRKKAEGNTKTNIINASGGEAHAKYGREVGNVGKRILKRSCCISVSIRTTRRLDRSGAM